MTYTLDWSATNLGGSAVVSYASSAILDFTDKPAGATAALSLTRNLGDSINITIAEFSIVTTGSSVMTFDYHTSSETNYDKLHIDVDGVSQAEFSGAVAWTSHAGINIASAGTHTIRFRYQKDGGGLVDADRVWVALLNITNTTTTNDSSATVDTFDMESGSIPASVTTTDWINSTSEPITGTRSLRTPVTTAGSGSYDLEVTQGASSVYSVIAFDWKVSTELNYDELFVCPDTAAANIPVSGPPVTVGAPGWLDLSGTATGRFGIIIPPAGRTLLLRYAKDAATDVGSDAVWIDTLTVPSSPNGSVNAVTATATALTLPPVVSGGSTNGTVIAIPATATALALPPVVSGGNIVIAVPATATALALPPVVSGGVLTGTVTAIPATADAAILSPIVLGETVISGGGPATATALVLPPVVEGNVVNPNGSVNAIPATATALVLPPVVLGIIVSPDYNVIAIPATATALAHAPMVWDGITPPKSESIHDNAVRRLQAAGWTGSLQDMQRAFLLDAYGGSSKDSVADLQIHYASLDRVYYILPDDVLPVDV